MTMLVPAFDKTEQLSLQVVNEKQTLNSNNNLLHAVACKQNTAMKPVKEEQVTALQVVENQPFTDKFTITFSYGQQLNRTKVLKVGAGYRKPAYVYKVVLNSRLSNASAMCWLQHTTQGWIVLLGNDLDTALIEAITTAIEETE